MARVPAVGAAPIGRERVGLGVSAMLMVIASFGLIAPPLGALLQEALDAAVILNALRARVPEARLQGN